MDALLPTVPPDLFRVSEEAAMSDKFEAFRDEYVALCQKYGLVIKADMFGDLYVTEPEQWDDPGELEYFAKNI